MKLSQSIIHYLLRNQVLAALLIVGVGVFLFRIRDIFVLVFLAYILMAALHPFATFLVKRKVPYPLAVIIPYIIMLVFFVLLVFSLFPFFVSQIQQFATHFPSYLEQMGRLFGQSFDSSFLQSFISTKIGSLSDNVVTVTSVLFGALFWFLTLFVISFYMLVDHDSLQQSIANLFGEHQEKRALKVLTRIEDKLGAWFRGQIVLSVSIGIANYIAYSLIGLEFALPLAILAGMFEIIPTIGPFLGAIPAVIVALNTSVPMALTVIVIYVIIQMAESNFLVPQIMEKAVGLNPLLILVGIIVGGELMGIGGALLTVPFLSLLTVVFENLSVED